MQWHWKKDSHNSSGVLSIFSLIKMMLFFLFSLQSVWALTFLAFMLKTPISLKVGKLPERPGVAEL